MYNGKRRELEIMLTSIMKIRMNRRRKRARSMRNQIKKRKNIVKKEKGRGRGDKIKTELYSRRRSRKEQKLGIRYNKE